MTAVQITDTYFMEHRAKLLDIAAFLDRLDRAADAGSSGAEDFRVRAFRAALDILSDGESDRARRVLESFSDRSDTMPQTALDTPLGIKGACGVVPEGNE